MNLKDNEPCGHPDCLQHVTHPCEGCERVASAVKPRVRFCWECGAKLYGNHFKEVDEHIVHKNCLNPDREVTFATPKKT
jgi:hypothetical protein